jgi:hypothetical protein
MLGMACEILSSAISAISAICAGPNRIGFISQRYAALTFRIALSGGHIAAPPSSVMNSRRLTSSMGSSPEPAMPAYSRLRMPRKRPQVLGADLNRSESSQAGVSRLYGHEDPERITCLVLRP